MLNQNNNINEFEEEKSEEEKTPEEIEMERQMNMYAAEQRQRSIEKYGRDIYTDKTIRGSKKIDDISKVLKVVVITVIVIVNIIFWGFLIWMLIASWSGARQFSM